MMNRKRWKKEDEGYFVKSYPNLLPDFMNTPVSRFIQMKALIYTLFISFFLSGPLFSQEEYIPTESEIKHFAKTRTMMVLEENPMCEYNLILNDIVPDEWKITPFDFISWKKFETQKTDASLSFLLMNKVKFEKDKSNANYLFMSLVLGGKTKSLSDMPDLCSVPLAYFGAKEETYMYKIGIFLRFIQSHIQVITQDPSVASKNIFQYYNKNIQKLEGKTLYLIAEELAKDVNTEAKIKKVYSGPFKLVTREEIQQAIADRDPDVVFLHKVGPGKRQNNAQCFKILVGVDDAQFYYFDHHKISEKSPDGFLASDFKKLSRKN
ncbi:MAG: hypothetical protein LBQ60_03875 [Bacteroidales bacterium]|jgi:hypothetical protein|nr:hypothetical protein [Bacteroidales bacterium]